MKAKLLLPILVLLLSISLGYADETLCGSGCNYSTLTKALDGVNSTNTTLVINGTGEYTINDKYTYNLTTKDTALLINASDVVVDCNKSRLQGNFSGKAIQSIKNNVSIQQCSISKYQRGIELWNASNSTLNDNKITTSGFGIYIQRTNNTKIKTTTLSAHSTSALLFNSAFNNLVLDSNITNSARDITSSSKGFNTVLNTSLNESNIEVLDDSTLYISYNFRVHVNDTQGNNINATVNISDNEGYLLYSINASEDGYTPWKNITSYAIDNESFTNYNNFTVFSDNGTHFSSHTVNISSSKTLSVTYNVTPPAVSELENSTTNSTCNVSFETDKEAFSLLSYGKDKNFSNNETNDFTKSHFYNLQDLSDETTYYYFLTVCNDNGYCNNSKTYNFTTNKSIDRTPPEISEPSITPTNESAEINFDTDDNSMYIINYGSTEVMALNVTDTSYSKTHTATLNNLMPETTYYYRINASNRDNYSTTFKDNFTTEETLDTKPPKIDFGKPNDANTTVYHERLNRGISFSTNEESQCQINTDVNTGSLESSDNISYSAQFNASSNSNGFNFFVTAECTDNTGNTNSKTASFKVNDTREPDLEFTSETSNDYTNNSTLVIYVNANEPIPSDPIITIDGTENDMTAESEDYIYSYTKEDVSENEHNITVNATDRTGNTASIEKTIHTDYTTPELDIEEPSDDATLEDSNILNFNLTLEEKGSCEYDLLYLDEKDLQDCKDDCEEDYNDCIDDAEDSDEEEQCQDERDNCEETCEDNKYNEEKDDVELELFKDIEDCKSDCEDDYDNCIDTCDYERHQCESQFADDSHCEDEHKDCTENCQDNEEDCKENCEDMEFTYFEDVDKYLKDGDFRADFTCEDRAGNGVQDNVSFTVNDITPPQINNSSPNGTLEKKTVYFSLTTSENARCKYSNKDISYSEMNNTFGIYSTRHSKQLSLQPGNYTFYTLCNDTKGNVMSSSHEISFRVNLTEEKDTSGTSSPSSGTSGSSSQTDTKDNFVKKTFTELKTGEDNTFKIDKNDMILREVSIKPTEEAKNVKVEAEQFEQQDLVDKPQNELYKYFEIKADILDDKIDTLNVNFRVSKDWLNNNNIKPENLYLNRFTSKWEEIKPIKSSDDSDYHYYQAEVDGLSMFAVTGKKTQTSKPDKNNTDKNNKTNKTDKEPNKEKPDNVENNFNLYLWILLLCVVVGGGSAAFFVFRSQARHPQQNQTAEPKQHAQAAADSSAAAAQSPNESEESANQESTGEKDTSEKDTSEESETSEENSEKKDTSKQETSTGGTESEQTETATEQDPISQYIKQAQQAGQTTTQIQQALVDAGHNPSDVEEKLIQLGLMQDEIKQYIQQAMQAGENKDNIRNTLINNGFKAEYVDKKLSEATKKQSQDNSGKVHSNAQIEDYIKKAFDSGMNQEQIRDALLNAGYEQQTIDTALNNFQPKDQQQELKEYVQKCFQNNLGKMHIKKLLKDAGYSKNEIKQVFKDLGK